jgi:hypothetical protein
LRIARRLRAVWPEESKETGGFVAHDLARNPSWFSINQTPQTADPKGK